MAQVSPAGYTVDSIICHLQQKRGFATTRPQPANSQGALASTISNLQGCTFQLVQSPVEMQQMQGSLAFVISSKLSPYNFLNSSDKTCHAHESVARLTWLQKHNFCQVLIIGADSVGSVLDLQVLQSQRLLELVNLMKPHVVLTFVETMGTAGLQNFVNFIRKLSVPSIFLLVGPDGIPRMIDATCVQNGSDCAVLQTLPLKFNMEIITVESTET